MNEQIRPLATAPAAAVRRPPHRAAPGEDELVRIDRESGREMARARRAVWLSLLTAPGISVMLLLLIVQRSSITPREHVFYIVFVSAVAITMGCLLAYYVYAAQVRVMERYLDKLRQLALRLKDLSERDSLTGLYNHGYMLQRLNEEISLARRHGTALSVVILDLDGFKEVNDRHGHLAGDEVLRRTAREIRANMRQYDVVARYGGDEFCIIMPQTGRDSATRAVAKLREALADVPVDLRGWTGGIAFSSGLCTYPEDGDSVHTLIDAADAHLYGNKRTSVGAQPPAADSA